VKPKRIYLIRHGESEGNVNSDIYKTTPDWKVPLTEKGHHQAEKMAQKLVKNIDKTFLPIKNEIKLPCIVYCSPWIRARQTAEHIRDFFEVYKYYEDPRLREQEWGNFKEEGLSLKIEKERYKFGPFFYRMPYGESGADVYDRMSTFLETLYRDFKKDDYPENVFIVTHGLTIKCFLMRWLHWSVEEFDYYKTPHNCEIIKLIYVSEVDKYFLDKPLRKRKNVTS
jgi:broad specificity phosphatase PhoE